MFVYKLFVASQNINKHRSQSIVWRLGTDYLDLLKGQDAQTGKIEQMRGKNMSKLNKRSLERKGEKKQKILDTKLMEEHLVDLTKIRGELEELPEEER